MKSYVGFAILALVAALSPYLPHPYLLFLWFAAISALCLVVTSSPELGLLCAFVFTAGWSPRLTHDVGGIPAFVILIVIAGALAGIARFGDLRLKFGDGVARRQFWVLDLFVVLGILTSLLNQELNWAIYFLLVALTVRVSYRVCSRSVANLWRFETVVLASGILIGAFATLLFFRQFQLGAQGYANALSRVATGMAEMDQEQVLALPLRLGSGLYRASGTLFHPMDLAQFITPVLFLALGVSVFESAHRRLLGLLGLATCIVAVFVSFVRGAWVGTFVGLLFAGIAILVVKGRQRTFRTIAVGAVIGIAVLLFLPLIASVLEETRLGEPVVRRVSSILEFKSDPSAVGRFVFYVQALQLAVSDPARIAMGGTHAESWALFGSPGDPGANAHNNFLQLAVVRGVGTALAYLLIFVTWVYLGLRTVGRSVVRRSRNSTFRLSPAAAAMFVGGVGALSSLFIQYQFAYSLPWYRSQLMFWALLGAYAASLKYLAPVSSDASHVRSGGQS